MGDRTGWAGRTLRLLLGTYLLLVFAQSGGLDGGRTVSTLAAALALWLVYLGGHAALRRAPRAPNRWVGAIVALAPLALVYAVGGAVGRLATLLFLGISLIAAGARGDPGCEVMALPGLTTGSHTHLACLLFSPIDWLEARLRGDA